MFHICVIHFIIVCTLNIFIRRFNGEDDISGYGFELTFRLRRLAEHGDSAPTWPFDAFFCLADYVFSSGDSPSLSLFLSPRLSACLSLVPAVSHSSFPLYSLISQETRWTAATMYLGPVSGLSLVLKFDISAFPLTLNSANYGPLTAALSSNRFSLDPGTFTNTSREQFQMNNSILISQANHL